MNRINALCVERGIWARAVPATAKDELWKITLHYRGRQATFQTFLFFAFTSARSILNTCDIMPAIARKLYALNSAVQARKGWSDRDAYEAWCQINGYAVHGNMEIYNETKGINLKVLRVLGAELLEQLISEMG